MAAFLDLEKGYDRDQLIRDLIEIQYDRNDYDLGRGMFRVRGDVDRHLPALRRPSHARGAVRRRHRVDLRGRPAHRARCCGTSTRSRSGRRPTTSRRGRKLEAALADDPRRAGRSGSRSSRPRASCSRRSGSRCARTTTSRCSRRWASAAASRTTRATSTAARRASRPTRSSTTSPTTSCASSTRATSPSPRSAGCTRATAAGRSPSSSTGSGCRARWTTGRCASTSSSSGSSSTCTSRRRRATTSCASPSRSSSRSSARPASSTPRSWCDPRRTRSTTSSTRSRSARPSDERVLVTTLTKKMAEDLTDYLQDQGLKVAYLHSDIGTLERVEILRDLRIGHVRLPRRHQPAPRGARPARGLARRDPRRRQGRLPAQLPLAHPDDRPSGPQRVGRRCSCTPTG